jgi:zinc protease
MKTVVALCAFSSLALAQPKAATNPPGAGEPGKTPTPPPADQKVAGADDPWANRKDLFVPPTVTPSTKVDLGAVQRFTLPNGLQVIAVPRKQVPLIDLTIAVRAGSSSDPLDKAGLAQFVGGMLRKGTVKRTADQISEAIDSVGGNLGAGAEDDGTLISCSARAKDFVLCLDLASDITLHPTFPDAEMGEIRDQLNASVEQVRDNPAALAGEHASNLFFGDQDPRGIPLSKKSLAAIDRGTIEQFYKTYYAPNNAVMAVSGDFDPKTLKAQLTKWFGEWKKSDVPKQPERTLPAAGPMKVRLVDKPDATQSQIVVVGPGVKHADPDLFATRLMNYSLGGGSFSSRLMKVVRSEGGKTYGARSAFEARRDPGTFSATTFTRNDQTGNTIKLVLGEVDRMKSTGPTDAELAAAKGNLIGGYGLHFETASDVARQLLVADLDGLPADYAVTYPKKLQAVTVADALKAAQEHLKPQVLVVVGNAKEVKPLLVAAKLAPTEVLGYMDPVNGNERAAAAQTKKEAASASPVEEENGKKLLAAALKAQGGDAVGKIKTLEIEGRGSMTMQGTQVPIFFHGFYLPGHAIRQDINLGPASVSQVYVDGKAFIKQGSQSQDLPPPMAASMKKDLWRDGAFVLWNASQAGAKVKAAPQITDGKLKFDVLSVVSPEGDVSKLLLDPQTHLLSRVVYTDEGKEARDEYFDYKAEGGIQFSRKQTHSGGDQKFELEVEKVKVNKDLPKDAFNK